MSQNINNKLPIPKQRTRKFNGEIEKDQNLKKQTPKGKVGLGKTSDNLKIIMWNVNGIRSVLSKNVINGFIAKYQPDLFCVNQTKINKQSFNKEPIFIKGYNGYWNFCKCSAGYSGVAIFSKFLPISISQDLQELTFSQQGRVLTLQFQYFYIVAVYVPSAGGKQLQRLHYKTNQYEVAFHKYCQKLRANEHKKMVIVCGDMNVSPDQIDIHVTANTHKQPGYTPQERKSFKNFLSKGWVDTFRKLNPKKREYTWWRIQHGNRERNIGKRLDYFLVNEEHSNLITKSICLGDVKGSDHCPVYVDVNLTLGSFKKQSLQLEKNELTQLASTETKEQTKEQKIESESKEAQILQNQTQQTQNTKTKTEQKIQQTKQLTNQSISLNK